MLYLSNAPLSLLTTHFIAPWLVIRALAHNLKAMILNSALTTLFWDFQQVLLLA